MPQIGGLAARTQNPLQAKKGKNKYFLLIPKITTNIHLFRNFGRLFGAVPKHESALESRDVAPLVHFSVKYSHASFFPLLCFLVGFSPSSHIQSGAGERQVK